MTIACLIIYRLFAEDFDIINKEIFKNKFTSNLEFIGMLHGRSF